MDTPICDFVRRYADSGTLRLHMPGHKGVPLLGMEALDITEIDGADSLYEASGIIRDSEANASVLFGSETYYSTEGSSQCIRAMLYLALMHAKQAGRRPVIAAGRNVHKTFLSAAALLDLDVVWLYPEREDSYLSCKPQPTQIEALLRDAPNMPTAVYLTNPDYLGSTVDLRGIAEICHRYGALLLVDGAHGAYLRFLPESRHPMDLGADICCASAHKTLPVLTGGAYLHLSAALPPALRSQAKNALALFGSTSPSYLILQSLDAANRYLADGYRERLRETVDRIQALRAALTAHGYVLRGDEPIKLTICAKPYGYRGTQLAQEMRKRGIECEFSDPDFVVLMLTPETGDQGIHRLSEVLLSIPKREPIHEAPPSFRRPERVLSIREAMLSPCEALPASECVGRTLAAASVGCPPAVPIVVCGERIDAEAERCFAYYGIESCAVIVERPNAKKPG